MSPRPSAGLGPGSAAARGSEDASRVSEPVRREHSLYRCPPGKHDDDWGLRTCPYCDGGLGLCVVCGGGEAELTTDCPGRRTTPHERRRISEGGLDFCDGAWRVRRPDETPPTPAEAG